MICIASSPLSRRSRPTNVAHSTEPTAQSQKRPFVQFTRRRLSGSPNSPESKGNGVQTGVNSAMTKQSAARSRSSAAR